jgi:hypothetical protein
MQFGGAFYEQERLIPGKDYGDGKSVTLYEIKTGSRLIP